MTSLLAGLLALPIAVEAESAARCWRKGKVGNIAYQVTVARNPSSNIEISFEPRRFKEVYDRGVSASNGTFFEYERTGPVPMADVLANDGREYHPNKRRFIKGDRYIDLGMRYAIGRLKGSKKFAVLTGDEALEHMEVYLGGGGILLRDGEDVSEKNWPKTYRHGPSFASDVLMRRTGRTAAGLTKDGKFLLVHVPPPKSDIMQAAGEDYTPLANEAPGANVADLVEIMRELGADDAVFFDGGGATAYAAGNDVPKEFLTFPYNPHEDLNATHIVVRACR